MYVSDQRIWKLFYKNMLEGKFYPQRCKGRQNGGGIAGMYSKKPYMIPVNPQIPVQESKEVMGKRVTPLEAVEERAKKDLRGNTTKCSTCPCRQYKSRERFEIYQISQPQRRGPGKGLYQNIYTLLGQTIRQKKRTWILIYLPPKEYGNKQCFKDDDIP
jgi:hypothetical protein